MVLVFRDSPEAPARCALEIAQAFNNDPTVQLRMGIHSGPVNEVVDVNNRANFAGAGINIAQRVMDCGDAGHILLSKHVAEDLEHYPRWEPHLHPVGEYKVKHGAVISVVNLYTEAAGNPAVPGKLARRRSAISLRHSFRTSTNHSPVLSLLVLGGSLIAALWFFLHPPRPRPSEAPARPPSTVPAVPEKSIAVLPFESLSANQETSFFADGIQDEILTDLAKVADLKVISRTSVMQYKTVRARNLREIGRQLGVAHVLEGSVQREGGRIRVNAQLIDARTDDHLWAQVYDRDVADVFVIQSEIAKTIADQLQAKLSPREKAALSQPPTTDLVADKLWRQAFQQIELASNPDAKAALLQTISLLEEALARDPRFLRAYGLLATAHIDLYWQGFDHTAARIEMAHQTIEKAAKINPDAGEVHLMRADYAYKAHRDYNVARAELELARASMPNNSAIPVYAAAMDRRQGRWEESLRNFERAIDLDPRNFRYLEEAAFTYQVLRRDDKSAAMFARALTILPSDQFVRTELAQIPFAARADLQTWRAELSRILSADPTAATGIANGLFFCALAERDSALVRRALESIRPEGLRDTYNNSLWSREWFIGLAARTFNEPAKARAAFTTARALEEKAVRDQPDYAPAWSRLGLIDAGLGRKEDAIREGRRACELLPVAKDAVDGPSYVTSLAMIYAWVGEKDLACAELSTSARIPGGVTYGELKLYPQWDALRGDPRFEKIVASLAPAKP
jgi:TolB-like protein